VTRSGYYQLQKVIPAYVYLFKKRRIVRKLIRRLKRFNWQICYLKKNKQTQWRRGYNNSRFPLLLEKLWYPMRVNYIKFKNSTNNQHESTVYLVNNKSINLIPDVWEDYLDLNDIIKKI